MGRVTSRHRHHGGRRVHTVVLSEGRLFEMLTGCRQDMNGQPAGYRNWYREHNQHYPDEAAAERAGLRAIERLAAGVPPDPAYRQVVLPLPLEHLWFLSA